MGGVRVGYISYWHKCTIGIKMELEEEIRSIHGIISELKTTIALLQQDKQNDKASISEVKEDLEKLTIAINRLSLLIEKKEGIQEGASGVKKWVWTVFGGVIIAWVLWVSTSIETLSQGMHK